MKKCTFSECNNLIENNRKFCSLNCQRKGRNFTTAFGNNLLPESKFKLDKVKKMQITKQLVNKLRDKSEFNVFEMFKNKYGIQKANELEKQRRKKEWNTKLKKLEQGNFGKFLYHSKAELTLKKLFDFYHLNYKSPARIFTWIVDFHLIDLNLFVQVDGIFYHGLDKAINEIKYLSENKKGLYQAVYEKFKRDRKLDKYCIDNKINLCRITDLEIKSMSCLNFENCWNNFRDQDAKTERNLSSIKKLTVNALRNLDISQSAAELLKQNCQEEGSEIIEMVDNKIINYLEQSRVDFINKIVNVIESRSNNINY